MVSSGRAIDGDSGNEEYFLDASYNRGASRGGGGDSIGFGGDPNRLNIDMSVACADITDFRDASGPCNQQRQSCANRDIRMNRRYEERQLREEQRKNCVRAFMRVEKVERMERRAESKERAESRKERVEIREQRQRAESREQRATNREQGSTSKDQREKSSIAKHGA
jgi:hypothetical protein